MKRLALFLFLAASLHATTYYVSASGNDSNPGTSGSPWLTPAHASSVAAAGDTVLFMDGTYTLPASGSQTGDWFITSSGTSGNPITFKAQHKWQAKIVGTGTVASGTVIGISGGFITIQDFDITGSNDNGINMTTNGASASFNVVQGNYIHDMTLPCSSSGGAAVTTGSGAGVYVGVDHESMIGNLVVNMLSASGCGPTPHIPGGLDMMLPNGTVANNIVINAGDAIEAWHNGTAATFFGNVVINSNRGISVGCGDAGACAGGNDNSIVQNNIIINGADDAIIETGTTGNHNLYKDNLAFQGNTAISLHGGTPAATGTVNADPLFVNNTGDATGNYRLQAASPAKMTGFFLAGMTADFAGNPRPSSGAEDIGAFAPSTTWYVRPDGGSRLSVNVPAGQCDGQSDLPAAGATGNHCAFGQYRYLWDDGSGVCPLGCAGQWVIAGGDTVIVRGCTNNPTPTNPISPACRIGWDGPTGATSNNWSHGIGNQDADNPPIPAGTSGQHTRILSTCGAANNCTPIDYPHYPYTSNNLQEIVCGFGLTHGCFNLQSTQFVDVIGFQVDTHNKVTAGNPGAGGNCTLGGSPAFPVSCSNNQPLDDYAQNGFVTDNTTANVTLQDVYIHGFNASALWGPIGGPFTMTRVFAGFNGFAGWNFADQVDTPNAAGSQILATDVTMNGNGFYEQYPIVNTAFPARAGYDSNSGGFGDAWSGQDTTLDVFHCNRCVTMDNTKDAFIGPHAQVGDLQVTNSVSIGNMGAQMKYGSELNANVLFQNNLFVMNCTRLSATLPGAVQNFNQSTGLGGSYLTNFCRAGGDGWAFLTRANSTNHFYGNTIIASNPTIMDVNCGFVDSSGVHEETNCNTSPLIWKDNNILGYVGAANGGQAPGLWFFDPGAGGSIVVTSSFNNDFGVRNTSPEVCGTNNITCVDPLMQSEPAQPSPATEAAMDVFNPFAGTGNSFYPTGSSPLLNAGTALAGLTTDYYGTARPNPPSLGGVELGGAPPATTTVSVSGTVKLSGSVTIP